MHIDHDNESITLPNSGESPPPDEVLVLSIVDVSGDEPEFEPYTVITAAGETALPVYTNEKMLAYAVQEFTNRHERRKMNKENRGFVGAKFPWGKAGHMAAELGVDYIGLDMYSHGTRVPWRTFYPSKDLSESMGKAEASKQRRGPSRN
jgi:hypothetical protein